MASVGFWKILCEAVSAVLLQNQIRVQPSEILRINNDDWFNFNLIKNLNFEMSRWMLRKTKIFYTLILRKSCNIRHVGIHVSCHLSCISDSWEQKPSQKASQRCFLWGIKTQQSFLSDRWINSNGLHRLESLW